MFWSDSALLVIPELTEPHAGNRGAWFPGDANPIENLGLLGQHTKLASLSRAAARCENFVPVEGRRWVVPLGAMTIPAQETASRRLAVGRVGRVGSGKGLIQCP